MAGLKRVGVEFVTEGDTKFFSSLDKADSKIKQLGKSSSGDGLRKLADDSDKASSGVGKLDQASEKAAKTISKLGPILAAAGVAAIGAFGASSVSAFANFESKMLTIQAVSDGAGEHIKELSDRAIELGQKFPLSAGEAADGFVALSKAGFSANEVLASSEGLVKLVTAAQVDMGTASEIVAGTIRGFGLAASDANKVVDILAQTANQSAVDVTDLGETFKYVAPAANAAGYSLEDVSVAVGIMGNNMIKGEQAGTSLRAIITRLIAPPADAAAAMEDLGIKVTDSAGKLKPFGQLMNEVRDKFKGLSDAEQVNAAKSIAGQEAMSGFLSIIRASDQDWNKMTDAVKNSAGAADSMAKTMSSGLQGSMNNLSGTVDTLQIKIGEKLAPGMQNLLNTMNDLIIAVTPLATAIAEKLSGAFDRLSKVISPVIGALQWVNSIAGDSGPHFGAAGTAVDTFNEKMGDLGKKMPDMGMKVQATGEQMSAFDRNALVLTKDLQYLMDTKNSWKPGEMEKWQKMALDDVPQIAASFQSLKKEVAETGNEASQAALDGIKKKIEDMLPALDPTNKAVADLRTLLSDTGDKAKVAGDSTTKSLNPSLDNAKKIASDAAGQVKALNDEIDRLNKASSEAGQQMNDASGKMKVLDDMAMGMSPQIADLWQQWKTYSEKASEGGVAQDKWNTFADKTKDQLIELNPKLADVTNAYDVQKEKLRKATDAYQDNTISVSLNEGALANATKKQQEAQKAADDLKKAQDDQARSTEGARKKLEELNSTEIKPKGDKTEWVKMGVSLVDGLIAGINSKAGAAGEAGANVAARAAGGARMMLQSRSPSKVFIEIGKDISEGLAIGIGDSKQMPLDELTKMIEGLVTTVDKGSQAFAQFEHYAGLNNSAMNQFFSDLNNTMIVFSSVVANVKTEGLKAGADYADTATKMVSLIAAGVTGLMGLSKYGGMGNDQMNLFMSDLTNSMIVFSSGAKNFDEKGLAASTQFADAAVKMVGVIGPAVTGFTALDDYKGLVHQNFQAFAWDLERSMNIIGEVAVRFKDEGLKASVTFAESAGKVVAIIKPGVEGFTALENYGGLVHQNFQVLAYDLERSVGMISEVGKHFDEDGLKAASTFSDSAGKVIGIISNGVQGFTALQDFKGVPPAAIQALVDGISLSVQLASVAAGKIETDMLQQVSIFGDATGKLFSGFKNAIDVFKGLTEFKATPSTVIQQFVNEIQYTVLLAGDLAAKADDEMLGQVGKFSDAVGKIFNGLKSAMDVMKGLSDFKSYPADAIQKLLDGIVDTIKKMDAANGKAQDFYNQSTFFANTLAAAAQKIKDGIGSIAGISGVSVKADISVGGGPSVPKYALGTDNHPGGLAIVGEDGPELVALPAGTRVIDALNTRRMMSTPASAQQIFNNSLMNLNSGNTTYAPQYNLSMQSLRSSESITADFNLMRSFAL